MDGFGAVYAKNGKLLARLSKERGQLKGLDQFFTDDGCVSYPDLVRILFCLMKIAAC